jgi:hypothetical protein
MDKYTGMVVSHGHHSQIQPTSPQRCHRCHHPHSQGKSNHSPSRCIPLTQGLEALPTQHLQLSSQTQAGLKHSASIANYATNDRRFSVNSFRRLGLLDISRSYSKVSMIWTASKATWNTSIPKEKSLLNSTMAIAQSCPCFDYA